MTNNNDILLQRLASLNLNRDEARIYLELLKAPSTHLKLARATGINRSKVYRLADQLEKRSLVSTRSDDRGSFLIASDPATLEVELVTEEENVKQKRQAFENLLPVLNLVKGQDSSSFIVHTYEGEEGFKQMLWHELKTRDEILMFGRANLSDLINNERWISQHQERMAQSQYKKYSARILVNTEEEGKSFTSPTKYSYRIIPPDRLLMENQLATYNDTISVYHWREQQKVGVEVINKTLAHTVRQMFSHYWELAQRPNDLD